VRKIPNALDGIRIIENTTALAAPFCGMLLSDLGAECIKIESTLRGVGDYQRRDTPEGKIPSTMFTYFHRNKKSIVVNLKTEKGIEIVKDLVKTADVFLENFSPGAMDRLGLGYEALKEVNPKIIYASISGFGHTGPDKAQRGFDILAQARSGLMQMSGILAGSKEPVRAGSSFGDYFAGLHGAIAILAALRHKEQTGIGQRIDIALLDSLLSVLDDAVVMPPPPDALELYAHSTSMGRTRLKGYGINKCKDGYIVSGILTEANWANFWRAIERNDLLTDPRTQGRAAREQNVDFINSLMQEWLLSKNAKDAVKALVDARVPAAVVNTMNMVPDDPQIRARDMLVKTYHGALKREVEQVGSALKLSETPTTERAKGRYPELGEHTDEVLEGILRFSKEEIAQLKEDKVLQ
jgi:crotonobetainyl-CoA:carnitine CoA-transferase CaiB-like acyl-CoA transferase